jgi:hypothetical protein
MKQKNMDRRKELIQQYKEMKTEAGVYQIKNTKNQKVLVVSTPNLKTMNGKPMMLCGGGHKNKKLQEEWDKFGEETFVFEVLEVLKELEKKWLEKLQPYGERGYN